MAQLAETFGVLGDVTRLRLLRLIAQTPLNVSELVSLVGVGQSSVSHHVAKLKSLELVTEERQGGFTYYSLGLDFSDPRWPLVQLAKEVPDDHGDLARLAELLRTREDRATLNERLLEPGQSWLLYASALASLLPPLEVADFGCGTGVLTAELARWAAHVTAIDNNPAALEQARARLPKGRAPVTFVEADLHALPASVPGQDLVFISQSLHHVDSPEAVLAQAAKLLKPSGRLVLLELLPHQELWVKARLGHRHLGFEPQTLVDALHSHGFRDVQRLSAPHVGAAFRAFLLIAKAPLAAARSKSPKPEVRP
jgi:ubiquinone/menaquinone biosynthesis C-methylase UbiE/DNA-binding transcriptional ArsR family regulator